MADGNKELSTAQQYARSYSSYSGADIFASINKKVFAEIQGLTYSISRAKVPIYTMGSAEPRSFSRGNRGIAGTLIFSVFDRDALLASFQDEEYGFGKDAPKIQKFIANEPTMITGENALKTDILKDNTIGFTSVDEWDALMSGLIDGSVESTAESNHGAVVGQFKPHYADEILPFDITLTFANEYGNASMMIIYGVEIMNEGSGFSTDTMVTEKAYTYMARRIESMSALEKDHSFRYSSSW